MITTTTQYKREMIAGNRNYVVKANLTLADGTSLILTNRELWDQGVVFDDAISSTNSFDIGSAIIGSLTLVIDNISGDYNIYDFANAEVVLWMGIENDVDEHDDQVYYRKGFYIVDDTKFNGSLITLECLDNMTWFDVPFNEITGISYPISCGQLVASLCSYVGVTLGTVTFPNYNLNISSESGEWLAKNNINCREVLQYVAQRCCCYCRIDTAGELVLKWYNKAEINNITNYDGGTFLTNTTPYSDGCDLDGGSFNPWNAGDTADGGTFTELQNGAWLTRNFEMNVSTEDIVVTGCRVRSTSGENKYDELWVDSTLEQTHERYVLIIENNPLITATEASSIANVVGSTLANLHLRAFNARSINDFSYEVGDMVRVLDFRGNIYYTWITNLTFTIGNSENFSCGAQSLKKRNETRFSEAAKTLAEANENASAQLSAYDEAVQAMNDLAQAALGYHLYAHEVTGSGTVTWLHNGPTEDLTDPEKPIFTDSTVIFKITGDGVFISDGSIDPQTGEQIYTRGYDANSGTAILNLIYAHGIEADWIKANTLSAITADMGTLTAGSITGGTITGTTSITSYRDNDVRYGYTQISGGDCKIVSDAHNYFRVVDIDDNSHYVAIGPDIAVRKDSDSFYIQRDTKYLGWAVEDAHDKHSSDRKLKKKIKDIPVKNSRDLILGARPRYYEFKKSTENGIRSGFVAQELRETLDDIGNTTAIERESVRREGEREVLYEDFIAHLVNTTKDLYKQVDSLKQELAELKARIK